MQKNNAERKGGSHGLLVSGIVSSKSKQTIQKLKSKSETKKSQDKVKQIGISRQSSAHIR